MRWPRSWSVMTPIVLAIGLFAPLGCGHRGAPAVGARHSAALNCQTTPVCDKPRLTTDQLHLLTTPDSCATDEDCKGTFGNDAYCAPPSDASGDHMVCHAPCAQTSDCKGGMSCHDLWKECVWTCDGSSSGPYACTGALSCGCTGQCEAACTPVTGAKPTLSTTVATVELAAPTDVVQVPLTVSVPDSGSGAAAAGLTLTVAADYGTLVTCPGGVPSRTCTLDHFGLSGSVLSATQTLAVQLAPFSAQLDHVDFAVRIAGDGASNSPFTIQVRRVQPTAVTGPGSLPDGIYSGWVAPVDDAPGVTPGSAQPVQVKGYLSNGTLALVDPTYVLAPRAPSAASATDPGRIVLNFGPDHQACRISGYSAGFPIITCATVHRGPTAAYWFGTGTAINDYFVVVQPGNVTQQFQDGEVAVDFTLSYPEPQAKKVKYTGVLRPAGALQACHDSSTCTEGNICGSGAVCVPAQPDPVNQINRYRQSDRADRWLAAARGILGLPNWSDGGRTFAAAPPAVIADALFDGHVGTTFEPPHPYLEYGGYAHHDFGHDPQSDVMGVDIAPFNSWPLSSNNGFEMCLRDFVPFVFSNIGSGFVQPRTRFLGNSKCLPWDDGQKTAVYMGVDHSYLMPATETQLCARPYQSRVIDLGSCKQADGGTQQRAMQTRRAYMVPCLLPEPGLPPDALVWQNSCEWMREEARDNGTIQPSLTTDEYVQKYCETGSHDLLVSNQRFEMYFCPAPLSMFGEFSGRAVTERFDCYDPALNPLGRSDARLTTRFNDTEAEFSGDLHCAANPRNGAPPHLPRAVPLYYDRDDKYEARVGSVEQPTTQEMVMLQNCVDELNLDPSASILVGDETDGLKTTRDFFAQRKCISLARFYPAVLAAGFGSRSLNHLLQQYIGVQSFVMTRRIKQISTDTTITAGNDCLGALGDPQCTAPPAPKSLADTIDQVDAAWAFLLDYRVLSLVDSTEPYDLAYADYRDPVLGKYAEHAQHLEGHEQADGLAVSLVRGLATYLDGVELYLRRESDVTIDDCQGNPSSPERIAALTRAGTALRRAQAAAAAAEDIVRTAQEIDPSPPWLGHWVDGYGMYQAARAKLNARLQLFRNCSNSLGINDHDTPIYFGDVTGTSSMAFASSDYLINQWTRPAIDQALTALRDARSSLTAMQDSLIQQDEHNTPVEDRKNDIRQRYGSQLFELCGAGKDPTIKYNTILDHFLDGTLTPQNCFVERTDPKCSTVKASADCYHGQIGEAMMVVLGAKQDVDIQTQTVDDLTQKWDKQDTYCRDLAKSYQEDEQLTQKHNDVIKDSHAISHFLSGVGKVCAAAVAAAGSTVTAGASAAIAVGLMASLASDTANESLDDQQLDYDALMQARKNDRDLAKCNHEEDEMNIGIHTAGMVVVRRGLDVQEALLHMSDLQGQVRDIVAEAADAMNTEAQRSALPIARTYWYDEKSRVFNEKFEWAKRVTYIALLAVQYEYQQELGLRGKILSATSPVELDSVLSQLNPVLAARTATDGNIYNDKYYVFKLRDESKGVNMANALLTVDPRDGSAVNEAKLHEMLTSPDFAVFNTDGTYEGQGLPFTLTPEKVGNGGMSLRDTCGERLWKVAAHVSDLNSAFGDIVQLEVRRKPTFYSQRCNSAAGKDHYQVASVSVGSNPFSGRIDARGGQATRAVIGNLEAAGVGATSDKDMENGALVSGSWCNDFHDWGLFGDYMVVFPWSGVLDSGYDLSTVSQVDIGFEVLEAHNDNQSRTWPVSSNGSELYSFTP